METIRTMVVGTKIMNGEMTLVPAIWCGVEVTRKRMAPVHVQIIEIMTLSAQNAIDIIVSHNVQRLEKFAVVVVVETILQVTVKTQISKIPILEIKTILDN